MYIYADESGNTGIKIFDEPNCYTLGAIITFNDIELDLQPLIEKLCNKFFVSRLHANSLDVSQNIEVANSILNEFEDIDFKAYICTVDKPYIATTKFVDTVFDGTENKAVPPLWYQHEYYRHCLCLIFDVILNDLDKRLFWTSYLESDIELFVQILKNLHKQLNFYDLDPRTYQVINDSLLFSIECPQEITTISNKKRYKFQTPNLIAFALLMIQIQKLYEKNSMKPKKFIHDRQSEFQGAIQEWHENFKKIIYDESIPGIVKFKDIKYDLGDIDFESSKDNIMLQVVDNLIWLLQTQKIEDSHEVKIRLNNVIEKISISPETSHLVYQTWQHKFSQVRQEDAARAKTIVEEMEEKRVDVLRNFYESKKDK